MGEPDPAADTTDAGVSPLSHEEPDTAPLLVVVAPAPARGTSARGWLMFPGLPLAAIMPLAAVFQPW
jgi:hypothetical protein